MLQTLFNKCGSVADTGSDAMVVVRWQFYVEDCGGAWALYGDALLDVFFTYCAHFRYFASPHNPRT